MTISKFALAGVTALALAACGKNGSDSAGPATETSRQAANVEAESPLSAEFRLQGAEPIEIDSLLALMPNDARPTYESAAFDDNLGAMIVSNLRFADSSDGESVLVERAEFYGVDLEAIERVREATEATAESPFETVLQKVRLLNVRTEGFDDEEGRINIGGVEFDQLAIRQGGVEGNGEGDEGARFFNAVNLAGLYFKDLKMGVETEEAPVIALNGEDIRFVGIGGGKVEAIIANDLEYSMSQSAESIAAMSDAMGPQAALLMAGPLKNILAPKNQRTTLGSFEWRDIDMSGLLAWGLKGETPPMDEDDLIDLGTIKALDLSAYIADRRVSTVEEATITDATFTWLAPSLIRAETKGASYDLTAYLPETEEDAIKILKDNGLDAVTGEGIAEWRWDAKSGAAALNYEATTEGLADFDLTFNMSALKLKDIETAIEEGAPRPVASVGKLDSFTLSLSDEKALDAIFALAALQMGGTADDLRQSAPAMIRLSGVQVAQMNARLMDYVNAFADFVADGGAIEIRAEPEEPLALTALQDANTSPQTLPDVLNLTVTHTAP